MAMKTMAIVLGIVVGVFMIALTVGSFVVGSTIGRSKGMTGTPPTAASPQTAPAREQTGATPPSQESESNVGLLDERTRKEVFRLYVLAQDAADAEAEGRFPDPPVGTSLEAWKQQVGKQNEHKERRYAETRRRLAEQFKITEDAIKRIGIEGARNRWPMPQLRD